VRLIEILPSITLHTLHSHTNKLASPPAFSASRGPVVKARSKVTYGVPLWTQTSSRAQGAAAAP